MCVRKAVFTQINQARQYVCKTSRVTRYTKYICMHVIRQLVTEILNLKYQYIHCIPIRRVFKTTTTLEGHSAKFIPTLSFLRTAV